MTTGTNLAAIAALVGDPGRANMLAAMLDGRPLGASELAEIAGVTPATASGHLAKLLASQLVSVEPRGRQRLFRLASPAVAHMLETMMVIASETDSRPRATPRVPVHLREARSCYDHLAGRLGVGLADSLIAMGAVKLTGDSGEVTDAGRAILAHHGFACEAGDTRRLLCRPCLDWSERRPHIGGVLGRSMMDRLTQSGWIKRGKERRSIVITQTGRRGLKDAFSLDL
jgi:DNA-binding transcriptional ArsR family regulator